MSHLFYMLLVAKPLFEFLSCLHFKQFYFVDINSFQILLVEMVQQLIVSGLYKQVHLKSKFFIILYNIVGEQEAFHNFYLDCFNVICLVESKNRLCFQKLGYGLHNFPYTQPSCKCSLLNYSFYDTYISANPLKN